MRFFGWALQSGQVPIESPWDGVRRIRSHDPGRVRWRLRRETPEHSGPVNVGGGPERVGTVGYRCRVSRLRR
jgi:hypothetical protein